MKVKFVYPRQIDGVSYSVGEHEVPDALNGHWFFLALLANNEVIKVGSDPDVNPHPMGSKSYHEYMEAWQTKKEAKEKAAKDAVKALGDPGKVLGQDSPGAGDEKKPEGGDKVEAPKAPAKQAPAKKANGKNHSKKVVSKEPAAAQG